MILKLDKEKLERMMSMTDDELWSEIRVICERVRISVPKETPPHEKLEQLRAIARGGKISFSEAMRMLADYKRKTEGQK